MHDIAELHCMCLHHLTKHMPYVHAETHQWLPFTPFTPFTWLSAASALRRSPSLKLFDLPPPGVLAPDITELARDRTFMTSGLKRQWSISA